jgi:hypothetical protein
VLEFFSYICVFFTYDAEKVSIIVFFFVFTVYGILRVCMIQIFFFAASCK